MTPHQTLTKHSDPGTALPLHFNALIHELDRRRRGRFGILLGGQSPWAALQAWEDWAFHLMLSSGKQIELCERALESVSSLYRAPLTGEAQDGDAGPIGEDRRFRDLGWKRPPFSLLAKAQPAAEAEWHAATSEVPGMARHHAGRVDFLGSFMLNALAPVNFAWTNPTVLETAWRTGGANFAAGASLLAEDLVRLACGDKLKGLEHFARFGLAKAGVVVAGMDSLARRSLLHCQSYAILSVKHRWRLALLWSGARDLRFPNLISGRALIPSLPTPHLPVI